MQIHCIRTHTERDVYIQIGCITCSIESGFHFNHCTQCTSASAQAISFSMQELLSAPTASPAAAALGSIDCQNSATANGVEGRVTSSACRLLYSTFL